MKITYYGYNSFIIDTKNKKMAIDPGGSLYFLKLSTVIPKEEWESITHIFVTHGDPDHYWHTDRVQQVSGAKVVCNKAMLKEIDGKEYMIGPRDRGLSFTLLLENLYQIEENETIELDDMSITGIKTVHRPLRIKIGPFEKVLRPGPKERIGIGSIGYKIIVDGQEIVNLGDTILLEKEWYTINKSDVLMIPIGGADYKNTMDEREALQAIKRLEPKVVIPCHYNCPSFIKKNHNYLDISWFKEQVNKTGSKCVSLNIGQSLNL